MSGFSAQFKLLRLDSNPTKNFIEALGRRSGNFISILAEGAKKRSLFSFFNPTNNSPPLINILLLEVVGLFIRTISPFLFRNIMFTSILPVTGCPVEFTQQLAG